MEAGHRRSHVGPIAISLVAVALVIAASALGSAFDLVALGCVDDSVDGPDACATSTDGLDGVQAAVISPDGKSVYAVSYADAAIVRFDRDPSTGALTAQGCFEDTGAAGSCTETDGLNGAVSVAVSPDGKSVYVTSLLDRSLVRFDRNTGTGALTPAGCINDSGGGAGCAQSANGLDQTQGVAVSPDGKSVYNAALGDDAIARFDR